MWSTGEGMRKSGIKKGGNEEIGVTMGGNEEICSHEGRK